MRDIPRVLIVDDDTELVQALTVRLCAAGYEVIAAADGEQGLEGALEARPDVIVMDIQMPTMDGLTALKRIRARSVTHSTPVIVLSACAGDRKQALDLGAQYFLDKPFNAKFLLTAIESSMSKEVSAGD